jgi:hypothetical protein
MNERIKELMVRAGIQFRLDNIPTHISFDGTHEFNEYYVYDKFDPEKFAELLIRECMGVAYLTLSSCGNWDHLTSSEVIAKHFGVE